MMKALFMFVCGVALSVATFSAAIPLPGAASTAASTQAAPVRNCPPGRTECRPGREGNGGCYELRASSCHDGRVCPRDTLVCRRGALGVGGCYDNRQTTCIDGLRCARGSSACRPGRGGGGGCYDPHRSVCSDGRITSRPRR